MELEGRETRVRRVLHGRTPDQWEELNRRGTLVNLQRVPLEHCRIESAHTVLSPRPGKDPAERMRGKGAQCRQGQCLCPPARLENLKSHTALGREL